MFLMKIKEEIIMKDKNNIFKYATKELSQDAFLCWSINWLNENPDNTLYQYGKEMLDLFLGENKLDKYCCVQVYRQYEKIDVLVMFKDFQGKSYALIIEDKTNTSEHGDQMRKYKKKLIDKLPQDDELKPYENPEIYLVYVKTGIMYDEDIRMVGKGANVVDLDMLLEVVSKFAKNGLSEILEDFCEYISGIKQYREKLTACIEGGNCELALHDSYGQFYFLDKIFENRSKYKVVGEWYNGLEINGDVYTDYIYSGTNRGGSPWIEYAFWKEKYPVNYINPYENEFHSLFWRVDCKWEKVNDTEWKQRFYIALRHYDNHAHSGKKYLDERKRFVYRKLRALADKVAAEHPERFTKIGVRENYKESDLLFIYVDKIPEMTLKEIGEFLNDITDRFIKECDNLYDGMEEALKDYM